MNNQIWDTLVNNLDLSMRQMDAAISKSRKQMKAAEYEIKQTLQSIPVPVMNRPLAITAIEANTIDFYATREIVEFLKVFGTVKDLYPHTNKYFLVVDSRYNTQDILKYLQQLEALLAAPTK